MKKILLLSAILFTSICNVFCMEVNKATAPSQAKMITLANGYIVSEKDIETYMSDIIAAIETTVQKKEKKHWKTYITTLSGKPYICKDIPTIKKLVQNLMLNTKEKHYPKRKASKITLNLANSKTLLIAQYAVSRPFFILTTYQNKCFIWNNEIRKYEIISTNELLNWQTEIRKIYKIHFTEIHFPAL